ncbi:MAG: hypothetical protein FJW39_25370 [Acidobacteria bacterium]|nr:hypothetical protein [Acidobacteriota bacterium]
MNTLAHAFEQILEALDRFEIPFIVGGSVASGNFGMPRQTNDIDIVADFRSAAVRAIASGRSFNPIHTAAVVKFDFFPVADTDRFAQSELARRRFIRCTLPGMENIEFPEASPEDVLLAKLLWFRRGGEVSDRQWHDILGILAVQAGRLDTAYLRQWADELQVSGLLARAAASQPSS